jgi:hypothetical protein
MALHEWFHIEVVDQHLHQRFGYNGYDVWVYFDGAGRGGGIKTVQWWTDALWGGDADWVAFDYGNVVDAVADGDYTSGPYWAWIWQDCQVYADGSWTAYWDTDRITPACIPFVGCWHFHPRVTFGYPPDW